MNHNKCDRNPLAVEPNNYLTEIVNYYLVYDSAVWSLNRNNDAYLE